MEKEEYNNPGAYIAFAVLFYILATVSVCCIDGVNGWIVGGICVFMSIVSMSMYRNAKKYHEQKAQEPESAEKKEPDNAPNIYGDFLPRAKSAANELYEFLCQINNDANVMAVLRRRIELNDTSERHIPGNQIKQLYQNLDNRLAIAAINDVQKCFERLGHGTDLRKREALPVAVFFLRLIDPDNDFFDKIDAFTDGALSIAQESYDTAKNLFKTDFDKNKLMLIEHLRDSEVDEEIIDRYGKLMRCFTLEIAQADDEIDKKEDSWLDKLLLCTTDWKKTKGTSTTRSHGSSALLELNDLIGLGNVKNEVYNIYNLIKIQKKREEKGMKSAGISYHCVFTGNPGTGKTTVARLLAQIYKELGILKKGHLVETDRSGLVAEYVGQTAVKTNKIIDSALDGVLFIDEAYSLVRSDSNDYGSEAIATLLKRMEDDRDRLVVILAGYSDEMKTFIDSNPGLQSRFNRYIHFEDYNAEELFAIFELCLKKYEYNISDGAKDALMQLINEALASKDQNFGNARFVRNLFERTLENQARRLASTTELTAEALAEIKDVDITMNKEDSMQPLSTLNVAELYSEIDHNKTETINETSDKTDEDSNDDNDSVFDDHEDEMAYLAKIKVLKARLRGGIDYVDTVELEFADLDGIEADYPELDFDNIRYRTNFDNVFIDDDKIERLIEKVDEMQE